MNSSTKEKLELLNQAFTRTEEIKLKIKIGMQKDQVVTEIGNPSSKKNTSGRIVEIWEYKIDQDAVFLVNFAETGVVGYSFSGFDEMMVRLGIDFQGRPYR